MPRIVKAQGGVVQALRAYDRKLRVRWSHEKKKWAVDRVVPRSLWDRMVPPVAFERIPGTKMFRETVAPEFSEKRICYDSRTQVVLYCNVLTWDVFEALVNADCRRVGGINDRVKALESAKASDQARRDRDRMREAYKYLRWAENRKGGAGRLK